MKDKLKKYRQRLMLEALIKSAIFGLIFGLATAGVLATVLWSAPFPIGLIVAISTFPVVTLLSGGIMFLLLRRKANQSLLHRVDDLGLEQRVITSAELENCDSAIAKKLHTDTQSRLDSLTPKHLKLRVAKLPLIILAVVFLASVTMTSVASGVAASRQSYQNGNNGSRLPYLDAPTGFVHHYQDDEPSITWDAVDGANGYNVVIMTLDTDVVVFPYSRTYRPMLSMTDFPHGRFLMSVYAVGVQNATNNSLATDFIFRVFADHEIVAQRVIEELREAIDLDDTISQEDRDELNNYVDELETRLLAGLGRMAAVGHLRDTATQFHMLLDGRGPIDIHFDANNNRPQDNTTIRRSVAIDGLNSTLQNIINAGIEDIGIATIPPIIFTAYCIPEDGPSSRRILQSYEGPVSYSFQGWARRSCYLAIRAELLDRYGPQNEWIRRGSTKISDYLTRVTNPNLGILTNEGIMQAVSEGYRYFIAVWGIECPIWLMLINLREEIHTAYDNNNISREIRDVLLTETLALYSELRMIPIAQRENEDERPFPDFMDVCRDVECGYENTRNCPTQGRTPPPLPTPGGPGGGGPPSGAMIMGASAYLPERSFGFCYWQYRAWLLDHLESHFTEPETAPDPTANLDWANRRQVFWIMIFEDWVGEIFDYYPSFLLQARMNLIFRDTIIALLAHGEPPEPETNLPPDINLEYDGAPIYDGQTPYMTEFERYVQYLRDLLATGEISPERRAAIERFLEMLR